MTDPERVFRKLIDQGFNAGDLSVAVINRYLELKARGRL